MNINPPKGWRKGQALFNALERLKNEKGVDRKQDTRLANTFHISDEDMETYWEEYINIFNP